MAGDGGPVFPGRQGLTMVDYFAGHIITGVMSIPVNLEIKQEEFPEFCDQVWALAQAMVDRRPTADWAPPAPPDVGGFSGKRGR